MTLPNVLGFFGIGFVMEVLPRLGTEATDSATSLLWLTTMGAVMMVIGGSYLVRMAWETLPREKYRAAMRGFLQAENASESVRAESVEKTRVRG